MSTFSNLADTSQYLLPTLGDPLVRWTALTEAMFLGSFDLLGPSPRNRLGANLIRFLHKAILSIDLFFLSLLSSLTLHSSNTIGDWYLFAFLLVFVLPLLEDVESRVWPGRAPRGFSFDRQADRSDPNPRAAFRTYQREQHSQYIHTFGCRQVPWNRSDRSDQSQPYACRSYWSVHRRLFDCLRLWT